MKVWKDYFIKNNFAEEVIELSAETGFNVKKLFAIIEKLSKEKKEKMMKKGLRTVNTRLMVAGIPNVGKSRLINRIVGKKSTGVGNKPGFTRGKQWVRIKEGLELLDTPGILWPKFENDEVGYSLAIAGAIKDEVIPVEEVAYKLIEKMLSLGMKNTLKEKYKLHEEDFDGVPQEVLEKIGYRMNMLVKGDKVNLIQAALTILRDYRNSKLGKFVLDNEMLQKDIIEN